MKKRVFLKESFINHYFDHEKEVRCLSLDISQARFIKMTLKLSFPVCYTSWWCNWGFVVRNIGSLNSSILSEHVKSLNDNFQC